MGKVKIGEWFWRFLAAVMLFTVAWSLWILYQINPPPLIKIAAFEAAARANVNARQNSKGVIAPAIAVKPEAEAPKEPPINADRLKFSDSLSSVERK